MTQDSALSQNWFECTIHTPMAQAMHRPLTHCVVSWRALGRIVAPSPAVSCLCPTVLRLARSGWLAVLQRCVAHRVTALPAVSRASCAVLWGMLRSIAVLLHGVSQLVSRYTQQPGRPPITIQKLNRDTTGVEPRHARAAPYRDTKPMSQYKTPCRARWAMSCVRAGRVAAQLRRVVAVSWL